MLTSNYPGARTRIEDGVRYVQVGLPIGYAPSLAKSGFHPFDGARHLRDAEHADAMLCRLVAHHSCAIIEAGELGHASFKGIVG